MQLSPGEKFAVVRQLDNPNDSGTYYVRAYIRDALTDALIETLDLSDRGGQRFSSTWNVYSKRNSGFYVSIATLVFSDAAYSVYSDVYAQDINTYLIEQRVVHSGGPGISYEKIRGIVDSSKPQPLDLSPIITVLQKGFAKMTDAINAIEQSAPEVNVTPEVTVDTAAVADAVRKEGTQRGQESAKTASAIESVGKSIEASSQASEAASKAILEGITLLGKTLTEGIGNLQDTIIESTKKEEVPEIISPFSVISEIRRKMP